MGLRWCGNYLERVQLKVPSFPLKCIVPTLNASGRKKKKEETFTSIFDLLCSFYCINFFATALVDREQRKVLLNHRYHSILYP